MTEAKKLPEIRFKGFLGEWEEQKLCDITTYKNGNGYENQQSSFGKYELINLNSISIDGGLKHSRKFINESEETLKTDDLVMILSDVAHGNLLGRVARIPEDNKFVLNQRVALLRPNAPESSIYLLYAINAQQRYFRLKGAGMSQLNISKSSVIEFTVLLPKLEEQQKIGAYFKVLDRMIELHQRKHDKLATLKQAMLQKMFPQPGATTPEIRFKGFVGEWEIKILEEVTNIYDGTHQTPHYTKSGVMFLSVENIHSLKSTKFISQKAFENEFKISPQKGDVLMTRIGDVGTANVVESNEPIAYYVSLALMKPKSVDSYFLKYCISSDITSREIWHRTLHIAFPKKINMSEIEKVNIPIPEFAEQQKIGNYFRKLDELISQHATQLAKLKQIKSACLAKMFV